MEPMSFSGPNSSAENKHWLFCIADCCGEEANCLTDEQWGEAWVSHFSASKTPTLKKRGCSTVLRYDILGCSYEIGKEEAKQSNKFASRSYCAKRGRGCESNTASNN